MNKHVEENKRVKDEIAKAFFTLLKQRHSDEISVTEITNKAKVSRMAYYRNFKTKLDIIEYYLKDSMWLDVSAALGDEPEFWTYEYGLVFINVMKKHRNLIMLLDDCGYASLILNTFNRKNEELAGDMPHNSIERYRLYYASGASFNGILEWIRGGCRESVEDMAKSMSEFMGIII